ncbi:GNAT family N-acetyltransferase [Limisalsivibrio acetivorans]|uniref:GNAT family N-acetyltransferase n=1 Tax=Limisalsivibrio acetivorans TaxID=1304888 RepID=UPI0003B553C1|nr:GNAT family N-acetyltransferase [Limisalsivibrio acetivorans]
MNTLRGPRVRKAVGVIGSLSKNFRFRLRTYRPHVKINIDSRKYTVKTIENGQELSGVLKLRHEVFYRELLSKRRLRGKDIDKYDFQFDHLAVIEKSSGNVIGTYRLNCSLFNDKFYSAKEFDMDGIIAKPGTKIELGRACIHPDYRSGSTIAALWKGLGKYMAETGSSALFGCSSVKTTDNFTIALIHNYLMENNLADESLIAIPRGKFYTERYFKMLSMIQEKRFAPFRAAAENLVPPLLLSYLKAGGVVCGEPAFDKAFRCYDYLTFLELDSMEEGFRRKFTE